MLSCPSRLSSQWSATDDTHARPNTPIVLADDVGCYGHPVIRSPNPDAFARQGFRLTKCYALRVDPKQTTDLRENEPERFASLRRVLTAFNARVESEGPDWWMRLNPNGGGPPKSPRPEFST